MDSVAWRGPMGGAQLTGCMVYVDTHAEQYTNHSKVIGTFEDFARLEAVQGPYGGQLASFEWVFSPRGAGRPRAPMFDRVTGSVNPAVVRTWEKYDIARILEANWPALAPNLNGKIPVIAVQMYQTRQTNSGRK